MVHPVDSGSHQTARNVVLALIGLLAAFWASVLFVTWDQHYALFGWNLGPRAATLMNVSPGKPVAKAGIRAGDRVDWPALSLLGRANLGLVQAVDPRTRLRVTIYRGTSSRTVTLVPESWSPNFVIAQRVMTIAGLLLIAIGIALVHLRPNRMTWAFLATTLLWAYPNYHWLWGQSASWRFVVANGTAAILTGAYAAGILIFMSRFPADRARGPLALLDRCAIPLGALVAALELIVVLDIVISPAPPPAWALGAQQTYIQIGLFVIALGALTTSYALTESSDRQRIVPVLTAFVFYVACTMAQDLHSAYFTNPNVTAIFRSLIAFSILTLAAAVAHGVIRHRVLDVSFALSRTLVYTILTSIVVGVFVLIDFISSKLLDRLQVAIFLEACVALAFGIWLNALHARIDRFVDRVLFRRRHLAEAQLERAANTLAHAEDTRFVDEALVVEAGEALDLASAAVFRKIQSDDFERTDAMGWNPSDVDRLPTSDHLVVHLRAEHSVLDVSDIRWPRNDLPVGLAQPLVAIPLVIRHELLGFVLYGGHAGGEALDPDEIRHLTMLANAAAGAYDHLQTQELRRQIAAANVQIAQLRHSEELLRQVLDGRRSAAPSVEN